MDPHTLTKHYTNGTVTVVWKPSACIHSTLCWKGLKEVFNPRARPWINMDGASTERIIAQVQQCPSGALSFFYNNEEPRVEIKEGITKVEVQPNGPLLVYGNLLIQERDGSLKERNNVTAFCRCGHSKNKPYCDGTHATISFE